MAWYIPKAVRKQQKIRGKLKREALQQRREQMLIDRKGKINADIGHVLNIDYEKITDEMNLRTDYDMDSLDAVELAMSLEETFKIEISDEEIESVTTVQSLHELINAKITEREK